jgi:hypothetical protein
MLITSYAIASPSRSQSSHNIKCVAYLDRFFKLLAKAVLSEGTFSIIVEAI